MKVAICTETMYPIYGVERRVYEMANRLPDLGYDVTVYTSTPSSMVKDIRLVQISHPTITNPPNRNMLRCLAFWKNAFLRLKKTDDDIIDANGHLALLPSALAARFSNKPCVETIHDIYGNAWKQMYKSQPLTGRLLEKISCARTFTKTITVNTTLKKQLEARFRKTNVEVIPNGVDTRQIESIKSKKKKHILFAGRLSPQKNVSLLIKAYKMLPENMKKEYELRIIGIGEEMPGLQKLAHKEKNVKFLGNLKNYSDVLKEMKSAELFVMPSIRESQGIAIMEAMASNTAVISTATDGPKDYIENNKNGIIVPINNVKILSDQINSILSNNNLRKRIAKNGMKTIRKNYDWNMIIKQIANVYDEVV